MEIRFDFHRSIYAPGASHPQHIGRAGRLPGQPATATTTTTTTTTATTTTATTTDVVVPARLVPAPAGPRRRIPKVQRSDAGVSGGFFFFLINGNVARSSISLKEFFFTQKRIMSHLQQ